jgi:hypothetical protein
MKYVKPPMKKASLKVKRMVFPMGIRKGKLMGLKKAKKKDLNKEKRKVLKRVKRK